MCRGHVDRIDLSVLPVAGVGRDVHEQLGRVDAWRAFTAEPVDKPDGVDPATLERWEVLLPEKDSCQA